MVGAGLYPTPWQTKTLWNAVTCLSLLVIACIGVLAIYTLARTLAFLQPLILPVAVAGVLSYLLEPSVSWLTRRRLPRVIAVIIVFAVFISGGGLVLIGVGPSVYLESQKFSAALPGYLERSWNLMDDMLEQALVRLAKAAPQPSASDDQKAKPNPEEQVRVGLERYRDNPYVQQSLQYLRDQLPQLTQRIGTFLETSITGVFGVFGFLFGLLIVPVYLFFFLMESPNIAHSWSDYLPIRKSDFKDEVVLVITEINGYLINFFRGQLVVSIIDGILTAAGLSILGLQFGFLIGLCLAFLGILPYIGFVICYSPAVLIATVQFTDWVHPFWVTIVFFIVQQIDGMIVAPRVVGNSVGLHPMTVLFAVFFWTLVLGGALGAVLAIPLTATLKVLLRRYVWNRERSILFDHAEREEIELSA